MLVDRELRLSGPTANPVKLWDGKGLYLYIYTSGRKVWRYDYTFAKRRRTFTIGPYPQVTLRDARARRQEIEAQVAGGDDPALIKRRKVGLEANTFDAMAVEFIKKLETDGYAASTITGRKRLRRILKPYFGNVPVAEIRPMDILAPIREYESLGQITTARLLRNFCSVIFREAILRGHMDVDPTYPLRGILPSPEVKHFPAIIVPHAFAGFLRRLDTYRGYGAGGNVRHALTMLSLTFVRPKELRLATWDEIDLLDNVWRIPAGRMKKRRPHDVPLVAQSRAILKHMAAVTGRQGLIFPSPTHPRMPMSSDTMGAAVGKMGYKGFHTAHGFRATASSIINDLGMARPEVVEMQLAHLDTNSTRRAYNRALYWEDRARMMREWANYLDKLRTGL